MEQGSSSCESAEFLAGILPAGSNVRMLTVVTYETQGTDFWGRMADLEETAALVAAAAEAFTAPRRILEMTGAQVSVTHRFGHASEEIIHESIEWGADVILIGHQNGLDRWFLGDVTESLVKRSPIPVLIVPTLGLSQPAPALRVATGRRSQSALRSRLMA